MEAKDSKEKSTATRDQVAGEKNTATATRTAPVVISRPSSAWEKILFLDVDGVLHRADACEEADMFDPACMNRLRRILEESGCAVVLSSSWRLEEKDVQMLNVALARWGIGPCQGTTATRGLGSRATEIGCWLRDHGNEVGSGQVS